MAFLTRIQQVVAFRRASRVGPPAIPADISVHLRNGMEEQFRALTPGDQRHLLQVYRYLVAHGADDVTAIAGLLHDVGKACRACRITIAHRAAHVLLGAVVPGPYRWFTSGDRGPEWTKELRLLANHARRGAEATRQAGYDPEVVRLIGMHETAGTPDDHRLALLREADEHAGPEHER